MRTDVRIRIRGGVIRIRISEARIRAVIRITAEQNPTGATNLNIFYVSLFKPITVSVSSQRDTAGKGVALLDFLTNVENVCLTREELLSVSLRAVLIGLNLDKRLTFCAFCLTEPCRHVLYEVTDPK